MRAPWVRWLRIQIVPRLSEPTLVTEVLVQPDVPVRKGMPMFRFDPRVYEAKVRPVVERT